MISPISKHSTAFLVAVRSLDVGEVGVVLTVLALTAAATTWIDLPLSKALFELRGARLTETFLDTTPPLIVHAIPDVALIAVLLVLARRSRENWKSLFGLALAVSIGAYAATELLLKPVFGRTDPGEWVSHHRASFHWFSHIGGFYSFPSGHAALATAALATLWLIQKPRTTLALVVIAAFNLAMVGLNIHFLSDVLAGMLVGTLFARAAVYASAR